MRNCVSVSHIWRRWCARQGRQLRGRVPSDTGLRLDFGTTWDNISGAAGLQVLLHNFKNLEIVGINWQQNVQTLSSSLQLVE